VQSLTPPPVLLGGFRRGALLHGDFTLQTGPAPVGYRVYLPDDASDYPPVTFEGMPVRCFGPLAAYQFRAGFGSRGTFGPLRPQDREAAARLRMTFFPDAAEADLAPVIEDL
jgi:hypothetical protein